MHAVNRPSTEIIRKVYYLLIGFVIVISLIQGGNCYQYLIGNAGTSDVVLYDAETSSQTVFIQAAPYLDHPDAMVYHPYTRELLVTTGGNSSSSAILRFNQFNGAFLGRFDDVAVPIHSLIEKRLSRMQFTVEILTFEPQLLSPNFTTSMRPGRGPMSRPYGMTWSSDGSLYVASFHTNRILVYARDGRYIGLLPESELLNGPNALLFGRDGALYVTTEGSAYHGSPKNITFPFKSQIVKFDGRRWSVFVDDAERFSSPNRQVSPNFLGLANSPRPDDNLLFVSDFSNGILAFDLKTAELMGRIETSYTGMPSSNGLGSLVFEPKNHFSNYTILAPGFDPLKDNMGCLLTVSFNSTKDIDSAKVSFAAKPNPGLSKPIVIMLHNPTRPQGP